MGALTFSLAPGRALKIDADPLAKMQAHRQLADDAAESGGVLVGRKTRDGHLIIDDASEPITTDARTRYTFFRSVEHQAFTDAAYDRSGGTVGWLGEWHTHAEPDPTPSEVDLSDWKRRAREDIYDGDGLVFVIVGQERTRAWSCDRNGVVIKLEARE